MAGADLALRDQLLDRVEGALQGAGVLDIGRLVADLAVDLRQRRAAQPVLAAAQVDVKQPAVAGPLQVGRHRLGDVGTGHVGRDHQLARRLHRLGLAVGPGRDGGHRDAVLAAVHGDPQLEHQVAHRHRRVVQRRALARQLGRPHPVARAAHVLQRADPRPHQVGQRFAHGHPAHRRRAHQAHDRLLADGGGGAGGAEVALGDDGDVGDGELQRAGALLLRHQPGDAAIDLGGEEALRADGQEPQHPVEGVAHAQVLG